MAFFNDPDEVYTYLAVGLAKGPVKAKGPVNKILKLVPLTRPLFPLYKEKVAEKDGAAA